MAFTCPECLTAGSLDISASINLPPDSRSDEIILQLLGCSFCKFRGAAIYEESRRGALDSNSWSHTGYRLSPEELRTLARLINLCPAKRNPNCQCPTHWTLGQTDDSGRWRQPAGVEWAYPFPLRIAR